MQDQAHKLRELRQERGPRRAAAVGDDATRRRSEHSLAPVPGFAPEPEADPEILRNPALAIASGKGGVGKSVIAANLSVALGALRRRVLLVDAAFGLAGTHHLFGIKARRSLRDLLRGDCEIGDNLCESEGGLLVLPASDGDEELADLDELSRERLFRSLGTADNHGDLLIFDAPAGIGRAVTQLAMAVEHLVVIATPERPSLAAAYALLKTISRRRSPPAVSVLMNQVYSASELELADHLIEASSRRLGLRPVLLGWVPFDPAVRRSVIDQTPFVSSAPYSPAARAVRAIARKLAGDPRMRPPMRRPVPESELIEFERAS
jgi:flagellar biosynthesis protein FlhG